MKKKKAVSILILALVVLAVLLALCLRKAPPEEAPPDTAPPEEVLPVAETATGYESPIDFAKLRKQNPDIYGWLTIPGTEIDYPVLQNSEDDYLYMYHNVDRKDDKNGALFTEHEYNSNDFSDPVTIIYGHHMKSGAMFGNLQQIYTDDFEGHRDVVIYTPEEELHYQVFAAVPYSNRHILYFYDKFQMEEAVEEFVEELLDTRAIGATVDDTFTVEEDNRLLVLSTCLQGNNTRRFLVVGKLVSE